MRPRNLDEFVGQAHLLAPGKPLRQALEGGSCIPWFYGGLRARARPRSRGSLPGAPRRSFWRLSAVMAGVKDIRAAVEQARQERRSMTAPRYCSWMKCIVQQGAAGHVPALSGRRHTDLHWCHHREPQL